MRSLSLSSCFSFGTQARSLGVSGFFVVGGIVAFTNVESVRECSTALGFVESWHPSPGREDHNIDGTRFVSVWNDNRAENVGDMSEGKDGEYGAGADDGDGGEASRGCMEAYEVFIS